VGQLFQATRFLKLLGLSQTPTNTLDIIEAKAASIVYLPRNREAFFLEDPSECFVMKIFGVQDDTVEIEHNGPEHLFCPLPVPSPRDLKNNHRAI
jgi:hypothetical protein